MRWLFLGAACLLMLGGCGGVNLLFGCVLPGGGLTVENVTNIAAGGEPESWRGGTYHVIANDRVACFQCCGNTATGADCTTDILAPNVMVQFRVEDGVLIAESSDGFTARGRVNDDGSFVLGAAFDHFLVDSGLTAQILLHIVGEDQGDSLVATATVRKIVETQDVTVDVQSIHRVSLTWQML